MNAHQRRKAQREYQRRSWKINHDEIAENAIRVREDFIKFCQEEGIPIGPDGKIIPRKV